MCKGPGYEPVLGELQSCVRGARPFDPPRASVCVFGPHRAAASASTSPGRLSAGCKIGAGAAREPDAQSRRPAWRDELLPCLNSGGMLLRLRAQLSGNIIFFLAILACIRSFCSQLTQVLAFGLNLLLRQKLHETEPSHSIVASVCRDRVTLLLLLQLPAIRSRRCVISHPSRDRGIGDANSALHGLNCRMLGSEAGGEQLPQASRQFHHPPSV